MLPVESSREELPMDTICVALDNIVVSKAKLLSVQAQLIIVEKVFCFCCCVFLAPSSSALLKLLATSWKTFQLKFWTIAG